MGWFLVTRRPIVPRDEWTVPLDEHLRWIEGLHEAGTVIMSGPSKDRSVSLYLMRAPSREEAATIADSDPLTSSGMCEYELVEWDVHQIMGAGAFTAAELGL